jgi:hypothetical protein
MLASIIATSGAEYYSYLVIIRSTLLVRFPLRRSGDFEQSDWLIRAPFCFSPPHSVSVEALPYCSLYSEIQKPNSIKLSSFINRSNI